MEQGHFVIKLFKSVESGGIWNVWIKQDVECFFHVPEELRVTICWPYLRVFLACEAQLSLQDSFESQNMKAKKKSQYLIER